MDSCTCVGGGLLQPPVPPPRPQNITCGQEGLAELVAWEEGRHGWCPSVPLIVQMLQYTQSLEIFRQAYIALSDYAYPLSTWCHSLHVTRFPRLERRNTQLQAYICETYDYVLRGSPLQGIKCSFSEVEVVPQQALTVSRSMLVSAGSLS